MGRLEKNVLGKRDSRNKGLDYGERVHTCGPVTENRLQRRCGGAVTPGQNQRTCPPALKQEGEGKAGRQE